MIVAEALRALEAREARLLLARATGFSEASVLAHPERELPAQAEARFRELAARRARGEPIAYILGEKEFYGLPLAVNATVLIPRPETELLVELALACAPASVLDLGTGSGAIALVLKRQLPHARVVAVEASAGALALAQRNAVKLGLDVDLRHGRWFDPVPGARFDVVVSNPPYVAADDPHLAEGDLRFEPRDALVGGPDGLDAIREIVRGAPAHLEPGGRLLLEHGQGQDEAVRHLLTAAGLEGVTTWPDLAGIARVTGGRLKC
ncbi:MAG TPA: peptide chain release factor N(5)-glutamine methyltransferase [Burkholderiales bacterium]|jgi:release factor glutamine methyltransferase|nr:peptide chain release factor N(5)-glutamine methyltransferase [Burkholderiales bacterium]